MNDKKNNLTQHNANYTAIGQLPNSARHRTADLPPYRRGFTPDYFLGFQAINQQLSDLG